MNDKIYDTIMKNKKTMLFTAILFALIATIPASINDIYIDRDLSFHVYRVQEMAANIKQGVWLPAIQSNNIYGYGYLTDIFYPNLFLYPAALLTLLVKNPLTAFKIWLYCFNLISVFVTYFLISKNTNDKRFSMYFAIFYILFPYKMLNFYFYGFLGEYFAYLFLPFVYIGLLKLFKENKWCLLTIGMIGIVYTHLITLLLASIFIFIYCIVNIKKIIANMKIILNLLKAAVVTCIVSSGFLIPFLQYMKSDYYKFNVNADKSGIISYGLFNLPLVLEIIIQILIIIGLLWSYKKYSKKIHEKFQLPYLVIQSAFIVLYCFVMTTKIFPWEIFEHVPYIRNIQFTLRIIRLISPLFVYIMVDAVVHIKNLGEIVLYVCLGSIVICMLQTGPIADALNLSKTERNYTSINIEDFEYGQKGTYCDIIAGEYLPADFAANKQSMFHIQAKDLLDNDGITIYGKAESYKLIKDNSLKTKLIIKCKEKIDIMVPLTYYKNYIAYYDNGETINITKKDGKLCLTDVNTGNITIEYAIDNTQKITALISIISGIMFGIYMFFIRKNNVYKRLILCYNWYIK